MRGAIHADIEAASLEHAAKHRGSRAFALCSGDVDSLEVPVRVAHGTEKPVHPGQVEVSLTIAHTTLAFVVGHAGEEVERRAISSETSPFPGDILGELRLYSCKIHDATVAKTVPKFKRCGGIGSGLETLT